MKSRLQSDIPINDPLPIYLTDFLVLPSLGHVGGHDLSFACARSKAAAAACRGLLDLLSYMRSKLENFPIFPSLYMVEAHSLFRRFQLLVSRDCSLGVKRIGNVNEEWRSTYCSQEAYSSSNLGVYKIAVFYRL